MTGRWKPPREDRTDADAIRREREFQQDLSDILEYGTEDDFVAALKMHKADIGKKELEALIIREKRGLY